VYNNAAMPSKLRAIFLSICCTSFTAAALPGTAQWPEMVRNADYVFGRPVLDYDVGEFANIEEGHMVNEQEQQALKTAYMMGSQYPGWFLKGLNTQMTKRNLHKNYKYSGEPKTWPEMKRDTGLWSRLKKGHLRDK
jgi:hypothetical protein